MAESAITTIKEKMNSFRQVLLLEKELSYSNRAVVGGLDKFLEHWRADLNNLASRFTSELLSLSNRPVEYRDDPYHLRETWVVEVLLHLNQILSEISALPNDQSSVSNELPIVSVHEKTTAVKGIGTGIAHKLRVIGINTILDLLYHFPRRHVLISLISDLIPGEEMAVVGNVWEIRVIQLGGQRVSATEAIIGDETGNIRVLWFKQPFVARAIHPNDKVLVRGYARVFRNRLNFEANAYEILKNTARPLSPGDLLPIYPTTEGLVQRNLRTVILRSLEGWVNTIGDYLSSEMLQRLELQRLPQALWNFHYPANDTAARSSHRRLAFNELFLAQLALLSRKQNWQNTKKALPILPSQPILQSFISSLPFTLTQAQELVIEELLTDMSKTRPMSRLIQGEVGSGKTVVALAAMLACASQGQQAAMMAPTEILAEQHFLTLNRLLNGSNGKHQNANTFSVSFERHSQPIVIGLLLGSHSKRQKAYMKQLASVNEVNILVGTHALIQKDVEMPNLALTVIDEQQRFGVAQRTSLASRGIRPHLLSMSATPIPRSLALTLYGDLDISVINQLPSNRQPVRTRWLRPDQRGQAYKFIRQQIDAAHQIFVVCPLIEESESNQTKAVLEEHRHLSEEVFPDLRVGLLHGRMPLADKSAIMDKFNNGIINILVSTPVVEVGVDVPNATVMLIEGAERFGLSTLHQFRGRVGRGTYPSYCILLSEDPSEAAQGRLSVMEQESDGFRIAEEDLRLRGPGQLFGTRQSGIPDFKLASINDIELLPLARAEASQILQLDPGLNLPENAGIKEAVWPLQLALTDEVTSS